MAPGRARQEMAVSSSPRGSSVEPAPEHSAGRTWYWGHHVTSPCQHRSASFTVNVGSGGALRGQVFPAVIV